MILRTGEYKLSPFFKGPSLCRYILGIFWILRALSSLITGLSTRREMYFSTPGCILLTSPTGRYIPHHNTSTTQLLSRTGNDCSQILLTCWKYKRENGITNKNSADIISDLRFFFFFLLPMVLAYLLLQCKLLMRVLVVTVSSSSTKTSSEKMD